MKDGVIAARYGRALFEAAKAAKAEEALRQDLRHAVQALRTDAALEGALRHPLLSLAEKKRRLSKALGRSFSPLLERFATLLLSKKRLALLPLAAAFFDDLVDEARGVKKVHVRSAAPLTPAQVKDLEKRLGQLWAGTVTVETSVDEDLIGGLVLRVGDKLWDGSLRGRLQRLKEEMLEAAAR